MNQYLKSAADRFKKYIKEDFNINPISKTDANIIFEIREIFKKLAQEELVQILDSYKFKKDIEIEENLLGWNTNFNRKIEDIKNEQKESIPKILYINIGKTRMLLNDIWNYGTFERYKEVAGKGKMIYGIKINSTDDFAKARPFLVNHEVIFTTEEERDEVLEKLEYILEENGNSEIINLYKE